MSAEQDPNSSTGPVLAEQAPHALLNGVGRQDEAVVAQPHEIGAKPKNPNIVIRAAKKLGHIILADGAGFGTR